MELDKRQQKLIANIILLTAFITIIFFLFFGLHKHNINDFQAFKKYWSSSEGAVAIFYPAFLIIAAFLIINLRDLIEKKHIRSRIEELREQPLFEAAMVTQGIYEYEYQFRYQLFGILISIFFLLYLSDRIFFNVILSPLSQENTYERTYSWMAFFGCILVFVICIMEVIFPLAPITLTKAGLMLRQGEISRKQILIPWEKITGVYYKTVNNFSGYNEIPLKGWWVKEKIMEEFQRWPALRVELLWLFLDPQFASSIKSDRFIKENNQLIFSLMIIRGNGSTIVSQIKQYWEQMTRKN
jgi:hypothetical protein